MAGIPIRTSCVLAFELTATLTSSSNGPGGSGDELVGNLTKNELMDVRLRMDMRTEGPEVLEEIID